MIPKINFKWSFIYQEEIHLPKSAEYKREVSEKYVKDFIRKVSSRWEKIGNNILKYMEEITNLKWKKSGIDCYVIEVSQFGPISDPLTIPINLFYNSQISSLSVDRFIDMMVHELIHNLFVQNEDKIMDDYFDYLIKKYKGVGWNAAIHVPVHAIHKEIFMKFFDEKRLEEEINACSYYPEYEKAWDIVIKEGSGEIIETMKKFLISPVKY